MVTPLVVEVTELQVNICVMRLVAKELAVRPLGTIEVAHFLTGMSKLDFQPRLRGSGRERGGIGISGARPVPAISRLVGLCDKLIRGLSLAGSQQPGSQGLDLEGEGHHAIRCM